ncbi:vWA domain-containing protein [Agitococcus lubricus]|uniref:Uncharacterized protein YegL n=1 Tax=Agitococcus lubricus TaxID=1077255 RepID=A0A2T5J2K7_9GAMM|nr:VWA domain-containing protein [Agitococcus lubricus]PTQ90755.1 uncharacterized protein YegL [Agitococcus lubricus]
MMTRRLAVYLLLDTSGSMRGEPIASVNSGLKAMLASLRQNTQASAAVHMAIITFDSQIKEVVPLTPLAQLNLPMIVCPESGATFLGEGLATVCQRVDRDLNIDDQHDWPPLLFIMTDGKPSDTLAFSEAITDIKARRFGQIVACAAGTKADASALKRLTETVVSLDTMDSTSFAGFFRWLSATVSANQHSETSMTLPPPPAEIHIVI